MSKVTSNLLGNFVGRGVGAALSVLLIPVYIRFLGVEAYGLVGFFLVLQTVLSVLDLGLTTTANREVALRVANEHRRVETRDLLRTIEAIYWPIGITIGLLLVAFAPIIAARWLHPQILTVKTIETSIRLMGVTAAFQWPFSVYEGVFHGLQKIVAFNAVAASMQIVRTVGALVVVWIWPTIIAFFVWQLIVSAVTAALLAIFAWRLMPAGPRPQVRLALVRDLWRFAAGMTATVALGVVLTEADRIVLSRALPLEWFGYYSLAKTVASGLFYLMAPISLTMLPRFTELLARNEHALLARVYHLSAQLLTVVLVPVGLVMAFFSRDLLLIWTRNERIAGEAALLLTVLASAVLLKALTDVPYSMQLAQGLAKLAAYTNLVSVVLYLPLLVYLTARYGAIGAALAFLILQAVKFVVWGQVVHSRMLPAETWRWYLLDIGAPALAAAAVVIVARLLIPESLFTSVAIGLALLGLIIAAAGAASIAAAPLTRARVVALLPFSRQARHGKGRRGILNWKRSAVMRMIRAWTSVFGDPLRTARALRNLPFYVRDYVRYRRQPSAERLAWSDLAPSLNERTEVHDLDPHYFYANAWATRRIVALGPPRHLDVGSQAVLSSILSATIPVVFIDYRPLTAKLGGLTSIGGDLVHLPLRDDSIASLSCLHVAEHIGLGRYGDPIDAAGTRKAIAELTRVLAPGGSLFFAVPVGRERVAFNAHRIHAASTIREAFSSLTLRELSGIDDDGRYAENVPLDAFVAADYACGLFWFTK